MEKLAKKGSKSKASSGVIGEPSSLGGGYFSGSDITEESLTAFMGNSGTLPGDRCRLLDARDKLMRLKVKKNADLATAATLVGTCPDMCPEKERYRRIEEHSVSFYEKQGNNGPDAKLIVKEYSRSSADQEQPLPHELRPPEVLEMTMNHLVCNVIDQFREDTGVGEWYDFVWNRTRSIRKDITQQDLCDLRCVSLVEKCARFHIHCAAVLCEEDASTFDPKINNINLTKSLQSLKYLYHDLMLKDITCENEAEFRAYDVLLNLNEGDILRQIQQYPQAVRESSEVKFASKLFSALNSHNYIRFFKLVKQASYLNSCIILRYFPQVRERAFNSIVKSYCMPSHTGQYSIEELVRLLAFEGQKEARKFCSWLGLDVDDDNNVILDRSAISIPSNPPPVMRAFLLIESKRTCSVGEVIHGGPLPVNPLLTYNPHNSFDDSGKLKQESYDASDQGFFQVVEESKPQTTFSFIAKLSESVDAPMEMEVARSVQEESRHVSLLNQDSNRRTEMEDDTTRYSDERVIQVLASEIVDAIVDSLLSGLSKESIVEGYIYDENVQVLATVTNELYREIAEDVIEEELEVREKEKASVDKRIAQKKAAVEIKEETVMDVTRSEIKAVAQSVHEESIREFLETCANEIFENVVEKTVSDLANKVATEVHQLEEKRRIILQQISDRADLARARHFFKRWHLICLRRRRLRSTRKSFPAGPPLLMQKRIMKPSYLYDSAESASRNEHQVSNLIGASLCATLIEEEISWHAVDIMNAVRQSITHQLKKRQKCILWKVGVLYPLSDSPSAKHLCKWISAKFSEDQEATINQFEILRTEHDAKSEVAVSVIAVTNELKETSLHCLQDSRKLFGLSSLIVFFQIPETRRDFGTEISKLHQHLRQVLRAKPPNPAVALQIFVRSTHFSADVSDHVLCGPLGLELDALIVEGLVQSFRVNWLESVESVEASLQLEEALLWLANNIPPVPDLKSAYLKDFIENGLNIFVLDPLHSITPEYIRAPEAIIVLFNEAMQHLSQVASNPELEKLSWPAPELCRFYNDMDFAFHKWNKRIRLERLKTSILQLQLPEYDFDYFLASGAFQDIALFLESIGVEDPKVLSSVQDTLQQSLSSQSSVIPWSQIFSHVLLYNVSALIYQDFEIGDDCSEPVVHYFQSDFMNFRQPSQWVESTRDFKYLTAYEEANESLQTFGRKHKLESIHEDEPRTKQPCWSLADRDDTSDLTQNLQLSILAEKEEAKLFISNLDNLLHEGSPLRSPTKSRQFGFSQSALEDAFKSKSPTILHPSKSLQESVHFLQTCLLQQKEANALYEAKLKQLLEM